MKEGCNENVLSTAKIPGFRLTLTSFIAQHLGNQQEYTLDGSPVHHRTRHGHRGAQPCCCEGLRPHALHVCYFTETWKTTDACCCFFLSLRTESQKRGNQRTCSPFVSCRFMMFLISELRLFEGVGVNYTTIHNRRYDSERGGRPWTAAQRMIKINQCRGVDFIQTPTSRLTIHYNGVKLL